MSALTVDGALYTCGERDCGKLGLSTDQLPRHRVPQRVKSIKEPVTQVACGSGHTVALTGKSAFRGKEFVFIVVIIVNLLSFFHVRRTLWLVYLSTATSFTLHVFTH